MISIFDFAFFSSDGSGLRLRKYSGKETRGIVPGQCTNSKVQDQFLLFCSLLATHPENKRKSTQR